MEEVGMCVWSDIIHAAASTVEIKNLEMGALTIHQHVTVTTHLGGNLSLYVCLTLLSIPPPLPPSPHRLVGYDEEKCEQPWTVGLTIKLIISVLPILSILLSLLAFHFYPITEQSRQKASNVLQERRKSSAYLVLQNRIITGSTE